MLRCDDKNLTETFALDIKNIWLTNAFSSNLSTINLKIFSNDGGIYISETNILEIKPWAVSRDIDAVFLLGQSKKCNVIPFFGLFF